MKQAGHGTLVYVGLRSIGAGGKEWERLLCDEVWAQGACSIPESGLRELLGPCERHTTWNGRHPVFR